jgi:hypothetical protein
MSTDRGLTSLELAFQRLGYHYSIKQALYSNKQVLSVSQNSAKMKLIGFLLGANENR